MSELFCAVLSTTIMHSDKHTREQFLHLTAGLGLLFICFCLFVLWLFALVVLGLVSSLLSQEMGWKEHLQNDHLFCVDWDIKP